MDPICCLLAICCPPGSPEQLAAFEQGIMAAKKVTEAQAKQIAKKHFPALVAFTKKLKKAVDEAA